MSKKPPRPMSKGAIARWKSFFCDWRSPTTAQLALELLSNRAGDHMLDDPRLGWAKEAWISNRYGTSAGVEAVRLVEADPPDFEARFWNGRIHRCEAVEVIRPGRRRGDELRRDRERPWLEGKPIQVPEDEWISSEDALRAVDMQVAKKAAKDYPEKFVLAVYVNVGFVAGDRSFRRGLAERQSAGHPAFRHLIFLYN